MYLSYQHVSHGRYLFNKVVTASGVDPQCQYWFVLNYDPEKDMCRLGPMVEVMQPPLPLSWNASTLLCGEDPRGRIHLAVWRRLTNPTPLWRRLTNCVRVLSIIRMTLFDN